MSNEIRLQARIIRSEQALSAGINPAFYRGDKAYLHIKYAATATPADADISDTPNDFLGVCADYLETDPTTASSYTWSRINSASIQAAVEACKNEAETAQAAAETARAAAETSESNAAGSASDAAASAAAAETAKTDAETAQVAAETARAAAETSESNAAGSASDAAASAAAAAISAEAAASGHPAVNIQSDTTSTDSPTTGGSFVVVDTIIRNTLGHVEAINVKTITLPTEVDISGKVDKVAGKGLSANDYTTTEKEKLAGLQSAQDITATVAASAWVGTEAPYTAAVAVAGVAAESKGDVGLAATATAAQREAVRAAQIFVAASISGYVNLVADGEKPTIDIPIMVRVVG